MVAGSAALDLLAETSLAACLVGTDRYVHHLGGWPT
jgi:hypothetical protein